MQYWRSTLETYQVKSNLIHTDPKHALCYAKLKSNFVRVTKKFLIQKVGT